MADSDFVFVPTEALIDKQYLATRADKIQPGEKTLDENRNNDIAAYKTEYEYRYHSPRKSK